VEDAAGGGVVDDETLDGGRDGAAEEESSGDFEDGLGGTSDGEGAGLGAMDVDEDGSTDSTDFVDKIEEADGTTVVLGTSGTCEGCTDGKGVIVVYWVTMTTGGGARGDGEAAAGGLADC